MNKRRRAQPRAVLVYVKLVCFVLALPLLTSCVFPEQFDVGVQINKNGTYQFVYNGILTYVLARSDELRLGEMPSKAEAQLKAMETEFKKDPAFKNVEYIGHAQYKVRYEKSGSLNKPFAFIGDAKLLSIVPKPPGAVEVVGLVLKDADIKQLSNLHMGIDGQITVKTDGRVVESNAQIKPSASDVSGTYRWMIRSLTDKPPYMLIQMD